jgi:hypothetical protein
MTITIILPTTLIDWRFIHGQVEKSSYNINPSERSIVRLSTFHGLVLLVDGEAAGANDQSY